MPKINCTEDALKLAATGCVAEKLMQSVEVADYVLYRWVVISIKNFNIL